MAEAPQTPRDALALYVHWPFCLSKCPYCDFNSHVREAVDQARWRAALLAELNHYAARTAGRPLASIFFGGGTPSLMAPKTAAAVSKAATPEESGKDADRRDEAIDLVLETAEALFAEGVDQVWGSMVKQTLKRRRPGFNETFYGFRSFSDLLEEIEDRELLDLEPDERSGGYVIRAVRRED